MGSASEGSIFVPFVGDGDIAADLYGGRQIFAADLDPARAETAAARLLPTALPGSEVIAADCNVWPFPKVSATFAVADLDSYSNPYPALVSFWKGAAHPGRVVIFGTDGHRQTIRRQVKTVELPSGKARKADSLVSKRMGNRWWPDHVLPFIRATVAPAQVTASTHYYRGPSMLYWGVVVEPAPTTAQAPTTGPATSETSNQTPPTGNGAPGPSYEGQSALERDQKVEEALYEAASSGNVAAADLWLKHRQPGRWGAAPESSTTSPTGETETDVLDRILRQGRDDARRRIAEEHPAPLVEAPTPPVDGGTT